MNIRPIILIMMILLMAVSVTAFYVDETFQGTSLNATLWNNISNSGTSRMNESNILNMAGNGTAGIQFTQGLMLSTKLGVNSSNDGTMQFRFQITNPFFNNQYFWGGTIQYGTAGLALVAQGGDSFYILNAQTGGRACSGSSKALDANTHTFKVTFTRSGLDTIYNTYWDGAIWCTLTQANVQTYLPANFTFASAQNNFHSIQIQEVIFTDNAANVTSVLLPLGSYCGNDGTICLSGSCQYGYCALKGARTPCNDDSQCLSGDCSQGVCTQADIWSQIDYSKTQQFGDTPQSNDFISMFLMVGIAVLCIVGSRGQMAGIAVGMGLFFVLGIFFLIIGWLDPFIMVGMFFIGLIFLVLMWLLSHRGG